MVIIIIMCKMRMKKLLIILIGFIMIATSCSTGNGSEENTQSKENENTTKKYFKNLPSSIGEDEYIIQVCENNQEINNKTMSANISFAILSKNELSAEDVSVKADTILKYNLLFNSSEKHEGKFDQTVCMLYNDIDWALLNMLSSSQNVDDIAQYGEISRDISTEYDSLSDNQFPEFYCTRFNMQFDTGKIKDETIENLIITIKGKEYPVEIGKVRFLTEAGSTGKPAGVCNFTEYGRMDYPIYCNRSGIVSLSGFELKTDGDVIIKDIRLVNTDENISLSDVDIEFVEDDMLLNTKWEKGKEIALNKGDIINIGVTIKDENFCEKDYYAANYYLEVEYESKGEINTTNTQVLCITKHNSDWDYAVFKDMIDTSVYYSEYVG